jgi:DNA-directed RNA polymerase subunit H (RpoH/RPB5)
LVDRSISKDRKNYFILKITPKKVILNHKVISKKKILDITELDELLKNNQIKK